MASSSRAEGITIMVPSGALGNGIAVEHVEAGIAAGAMAIAVDAGSTDSGPSYLARGVSKWSREPIKRDLEILMTAREKAGIPLLIGSCGTSGCDDAVNWTRDIALEIASERGLKPKVALLYSEQDPKVLKERNAQGRIRALAPSDPLADAEIDKCDHIVALMGPEPYIAALKQGADVILGGRTTDTAVMGAFALMHGTAPGPTWHAAKTAECAGVVTVKRGDGGVIFTAFDDRFEIEPLSPGNRCDVNSVSAHMLYENSDPYILPEPGGILNVTKAVYSQLNDRRVKVTGSLWHPQPYTMKLEGAGRGPFQTISLLGIEDPKVLSALDLFQERLMAEFHRRVEKNFGKEAGDYDLSLRIYGWNAVSGRKMPADAARPHEVGMLLVVTAATQELATRITQSLNPIFFHFPLSPELPQPSYAFPFTPQEIERGPVFRFYLNHVVEAKDGLELVRTAWVDLSKSSTLAKGKGLLDA